MAEGDGRWIGEEWLETCLAQVKAITLTLTLTLALALTLTLPRAG